MSRVAIRDIEYSLPENEITNEQLSAENPSWDMAVVEQRSGVVSRRIARKDQTALDLAVDAGEILVVDRSGQVQPDDFGAYGIGERADVERLRRNVRGI